MTLPAVPAPPGPVPALPAAPYEGQEFVYREREVTVVGGTKFYGYTAREAEGGGGACCCFAIIILVIFLAVKGAFEINKGCSTVKLGEEIRTGDNYIGLIFAECPTANTLEGLTRAADRWSAIISENKIIQVDIPLDTNTEEICDLDFPHTNQIIKAGSVADHLVLFVEFVNIEDSVENKGRVGFCDLFDENFLPLYGVMQLDLSDGYIAQGDILLHHMGHALGIGTLWPKVVPGGGRAASVDESLIRDPVLDFIGNGNVVVNEENKPKFIGPNAVAQFSALGGSGSSVPVQDAGPFLRDILAGANAIDVHWAEGTFVNELMTYSFDFGEKRPLSSVTIASLADLGYAVDLSQADNFFLPNALLRGDLGELENVKPNLRATERNKAKEKAVISLANDVTRVVHQKDIKFVGKAFLDNVYARRKMAYSVNAKSP